MKIAFMGTPDFAVPCLERLISDGHQVVGVFTQPDKPRGRKMTLTPPPVKVLAQEAGIPVWQPVKLRDGTALATLQDLAPELVVAVAYGRILPRELLWCPPMGCINVHASLLPKYRGAAPIQWTVINGDPVAGVTTMFMAEGLDTGDIILQAETPVGPDETSGELFGRLAPLGAQCLSDTLALFAAGNVPRTPQVEDEATLAPMLDKSMGLLNFSWDAHTLHNLVRGLNPWPGAWVKFGDKTLKIHTTRPVEGSGAPGSVIPGKAPIVACGRGALELVTVQPEGKSPMAGVDWARGARIAPGTVLHGQ